MSNHEIIPYAVDREHMPGIIEALRAYAVKEEITIHYVGLDDLKKSDLAEQLAQPKIPEQARPFISQVVDEKTRGNVLIATANDIRMFAIKHTLYTPHGISRLTNSLIRSMNQIDGTSDLGPHLTAGQNEHGYPKGLRLDQMHHLVQSLESKEIQIEGIGPHGINILRKYTEFIELPKF